MKVAPVANSWSNTFQSSLTLPTGATTGARIVLDGANDVIQVYNSAGALVDTIGGPNGAITIGPPGGQQVVLVEQSGLGSIMFPTGSTHERTPSEIQAGRGNQNLPNEFLAFELIGASTTTATDKIRIQLNSQAEDGSSNANIQFVTTHADNTNVVILSADENQVTFSALTLFLANPFVTGAIIKLGATWQTPSYGTNWSASTTFNGNAGIHPLQYRLDAEDNVNVVGAFKAGASVPVNPVFNLPSAYRPQNAMPMWCQRNNGGVITTGSIYVNSNGNFDLFGSMGLGIAANNEYLVSGTFPLNNIS